MLPIKIVYKIYGISDCPYCLQAQALCMEKDVEYIFINLDFAKTFRDNLLTRYNWTTFPIVVILFREGSEEFIGGFDELKTCFID